MSLLQVAFNATTMVAKVQNDGDAAGAGFTILDTFNHFDDAADQLGDDGATTSENHTLFHHVQDILYAEGYEDMSAIEIQAPSIVGLSIVIASDTFTDAETSQITPTFDPVETVDKRIVYSSSDEAVATVDADGLVSGVAAGTATITATSVSDARFSDSVDVTVTAA